MAKEPKLITCKHCGQQIAVNAKTCPQCGGKNKKPFYTRWWFWTIVVLILIGSFGGGNDNDDAKKVSTATESTTSSSSENAKVETKTEEEIILPEISNAVIYEGHDVVITATDIKKSGKGFDVNLLIENNSALNLGFNAHAYAVNGIMTRNNIYSMDCDVAAGKKANVALELKGSVLEEYGIKEVRCIDVLLWAYDNDKSFKEFDTDQIEIQTSLYDGKHDVIQGTNIYDQDGIKVDYLSAKGDEYNFVITNNTGAYVNFDFNEITINDFTNSDTDFDLYDEVVLNDSQVVVTVKVRSDFKETNKIETVETIEWNMELRPYGDYFNSKKIGPIVYSVN